ncbi:hypothetical protein FJ251_01495 [bacterium]|nr:hypothetical protein [bacterium]
MPEALRVVAHFGDGSVIKGNTWDFNPTGQLFHLFPIGSTEAREVRCDQLKALYFVKTFEGDRERPKLQGFLAAPPETSKGKKVAVLFRDGELECGYSLTYNPTRSGFFLFPADSGSNNIRVFVMVASAAEIKAGPAADALAAQVLAGQAGAAKGPAKKPSA